MKFWSSKSRKLEKRPESGPDLNRISLFETAFAFAIPALDNYVLEDWESDHLNHNGLINQKYINWQGYIAARDIEFVRDGDRWLKFVPGPTKKLF